MRRFRATGGRDATHNAEGLRSDDTGDMDALELFADADVEVLVGGGTPDGRDDLAALASLLAEVRRSATTEPPPMGPVLRAELDASGPRLRAVTPVRDQPGRSPHTARWRASVAASVASVALVTGVGVSAAQNSLPPFVQDLVSSSARIVGVDLPRSADRGGPPATTPGATTPAAPGGRDDRGTPATPAVPGSPEARGDRTGESPSATAPGRIREEPPSQTAPGQVGESPSETAPGQVEESPSQTAPGQVEEAPAPSNPGQDTEAPPPEPTVGPPDGPPGQNPGQGTPGQGTPGQGTPGQGIPGQNPGQGNQGQRS